MPKETSSASLLFLTIFRHHAGLCIFASRFKTTFWRLTVWISGYRVSSFPGGCARESSSNIPQETRISPRWVYRWFWWTDTWQLILICLLSGQESLGSRDRSLVVMSWEVNISWAFHNRLLLTWLEQLGISLCRRWWLR